jgi:hypothetical protein
MKDFANEVCMDFYGVGSERERKKERDAVEEMSREMRQVAMMGGGRMWVVAVVTVWSSRA